MQTIDFNKMKCIILDIDNTLTNDNREITEYTKKVIAELVKKGIYVILCTGRTIKRAITPSKLCNSSPIVIANNGAIIYNYNLKKIYYSETIPKKLLKHILGICIKYNVDCIFNAINKRYRLKEIKKNYFNDVLEIDSLESIKENVFQIAIVDENKEKIQECYELISMINDIKINNIRLNLNKEKLSFFEINLKGVSKGSAILKLMDYLNLDNEEIVCFGDSNNDLSMFEVCKNSVAMQNADNNLKEKACMITEYSNNEDGLARFLAKYFL